MRTLSLLTALALALAVTLTACDSGEGGAAGELAESNVKINRAVSVGLTGGAAFREARTRPSYPCTGGGSVDVTQSGTSYDMTFDDCFDVSGFFDVAVTSGGSFTSTQTRFDGALTVANSCEVTYDAFRATTAIDLQTSRTTLTYDGAIDATCPSGTTSCRFDGATFEIGADGSGAPASLEGYCE